MNMTIGYHLIFYAEYFQSFSLKIKVNFAIEASFIGFQIISINVDIISLRLD